MQQNVSVDVKNGNTQKPHNCNNKLLYSKNFNVNSGIKFNGELLNFCKSDIFKNKQIDLDISMYIDSFENWVSY